MDLNLIELLWDQLDCKVREKYPTRQSHQWQVLQEAWGEMSPEYLDKLTARMPRQMLLLLHVEDFLMRTL